MRRKVEKKSWRVLSLATAIFFLGLAFFILDKFGTKIPEKSLVSEPGPQIASRAAPVNSSALKGYPAPAKFRTFSYPPAQNNSASSLEFNLTCADKYIAFLIFSKNLDYRADPTKAILNRAVLCPESKKLIYRIESSELVALAKGEYYYFAADQPESGLWYNPR